MDTRPYRYLIKYLNLNIMKNSKIVIYILISVVVGIGIGWLINPQNTLSKSDDHHIHVGKDEHAEAEIWTCSMHPQIRQNEPGVCPICEMDLIPLANTDNSNDPTTLKMSAAALKLAQIETTIIGSADYPEQARIKVDGTVELDQSSLKSQSAHIPGRLETMLINYEGMYVQKGQKIGSIYSTALLAASQELITAIQFEDQVAGLQEASIQKLKNWKITDDQIASIVETGEPVATIDLYSDHSGFVTKKIKNQGDYVGAGQAIYQVGSTGRLWLNFSVFESDLGHVSLGQTINFQTPSYPGRSFDARISFIDPLLDPTSRTATIRAEISNSGNLLKPGMLLKGWVNISKTSSETLQVPRTSVLWTGRKSVVYVKLPDTEVPTFQYRNITIDDQNMGDNITVLDGLKSGEEIVTHGAFAVDAAAQLNNKSSMINGMISADGTRNDLPDYREVTSSEFLSQIMTIVHAYLDIKKSLVNSDVDLTSSAAKNMQQNIDNINMGLLESSPHQFWMEKASALKSHVDILAQSTDIELQRKQFEFISDQMIEVVKVFGVESENLYVQYCPMAFENKGADWISDVPEIRNPYFGDAMLTCGIVTDSIIAIN